MKLNISKLNSGLFFKNIKKNYRIKEYNKYFLKIFFSIISPK